jgi:cytidylate kinase
VSEVTIVTGPPGAGKTSVCAELAARAGRSVHLETDLFFGAIKAGYILPWLPESEEQNRACITAAARSAEPYARAGYEVLIDGIVHSWSLPIYVSELAPAEVPVHLVVLLPSPGTIQHRGTTRTTNLVRVPDDVFTQQHDHFVRDGFDAHLLDTSGMTLAETLERVLSDRARGRFLLSAAYRPT